MPRYAPRFAIALFLVAGAAWCDEKAPAPAAAAEEPAAEKAPEAAEQIAAWVRQLSADRFAERELATQKLIEAGRDSIAPVVEAVQAKDPETIERGLHVLRQLGLSDDEATEDAARMALEKLAANEDLRASRRAKNTLAHLNELRQDRAIAAIRKLGGVVEESTVNRFVGVWQVSTTYDVTIDESWKGGKRGLKYIRWLPDLRMVTFRGEQVQSDWLASIAGLDKLSAVELNRTNVGDAGMEAITELPNLRQLSVKYSPITDAAVDNLKEVKTASVMMLFGTDITPQGAARLEEALADTGVRVDYRRGAFLGVGCHQTEAGCTISQIHPDSAAQRADIRVGDIVTQYAGQPVPDFQTLTSLISENVAGDKVTLKVRRGGDEELTKEVTLGKWD